MRTGWNRLNNSRRTGAALGAIALACAGAAAQPDHSSARLISPSQALVAGQSNTLALAFELDKGWHLYWNGINDTGMPVSMALNLPEGWSAEPLMEPVPERHVANGDLLDHVLYGKPTMLFRVDVPEDAAGTSVTITGEASWLVCDEACLLDDERLSLTLPVVALGETAEPTTDAGTIENAERALPTPVGGPVPWAGWAWDGATLVIETLRPAGEAAAKSTLEFYPAAGSAPIADLVHAGTNKSGTLRLTPADSSGSSSGQDASPPTVRGVLASRLADGTVRAAWLSARVPTETAGLAPSER